MKKKFCPFLQVLEQEGNLLVDVFHRFVGQYRSYFVLLVVHLDDGFALLLECLESFSNDIDLVVGSSGCLSSLEEPTDEDFLWAF